MTELTHIDAKGSVRMVDVSNKEYSHRKASARAVITLSVQAADLIKSGKHHKGDVFATARIAGIQAAKKCSDLIPLCHLLPLSQVVVDLELQDTPPRVEITTTASAHAKTGVEMEALCAASVAALTIYDMCKAVDKKMVVQEIFLLEKKGGKSDYKHL